MGCSSSSSSSYPVCSPSRAISACRSYNPDEFTKILHECEHHMTKMCTNSSQYSWPLVGTPKRTVLMHLLTGSKKAVPEQSLLECLRLVLESPYGKDIDATTTDSARLAAIDLAAGAGGGIFSPKALHLLLQKGARADKIADDGSTALHHYCRQRNHGPGDEFESLCSEIIPLFLENGADVNKSDKGGRSPLYWAVSSGYPILVKVLLLNGAKPDITDLERVDLVTRYDEAGKELVKKYIRLAIEAHKPEEEEKEKKVEPQLTTLRTPAMIATLNPGMNGNIVSPRVANSHTLKKYESAPASRTMSGTQSLGPSVLGPGSTSTTNPLAGTQSFKGSTTLVIPSANPNINATIKPIAMNIVPKGTMKNLKKQQELQASKSTTPTRSSGSNTPTKEKKPTAAEEKAAKAKKYATVRSRSSFGENGGLPSARGANPHSIGSAAELAVPGTQSVKTPRKAAAATVRAAKVQPRGPSMDLDNMGEK